MASTVLELHGQPLSVKNSFLHIDIPGTATSKQRSKSAPAKLERIPEISLDHHPEKKRKIKHDDDDLALQEARGLVLSEMWIAISKHALEKEREQVKEEWTPKKMKLRFSLKQDGFLQVVRILNLSSLSLSGLRSMGIIRESGRSVDVYVSDERMQQERSMQILVEEGKLIEEQSKTHFYLMHIGRNDRGVKIPYNPNKTLTNVKISASMFYEIGDITKIKLSRFNYENLNGGKTLVKCNIFPGDLIRVTV